MNKMKLLNELIKALGLTPQEVVKHWRDSGEIESALFSRSQAKSKRQRKQATISEPKSKADIAAMTDADIFGVFKKILSEKMGFEEDKIDLDSCFIELGVDSLDLMEFTMEIEEHFGISIPDRYVSSLKTVREFVDYLTSRKVL